MGTIYVLRNTLNGKCYVGQTTRRISDRLYSHKKARSPIGLAILKYGDDTFEIHRFTVPELLLDLFETELIGRLNSTAPHGYNLSYGGQQHRRFSLESRERMRLSHVGKIQRPESIEKRILPLRGRKRPPEVIKAMHDYWTGRPILESTKEKISASLRGNIPWNKGKPQSKEHRTKNSISHIGIRPSQETRLKMSAARKGKPKPWLRGKIHSEEYKRRMSEILKTSWARRKAG